MTHSEKKFDEAVKETDYFCPVVIKELMNVVKEKTTISKEVSRVLENFKEFNAD